MPSFVRRTAVSELSERLWAEYEAFAGRDLSEFEIIDLFVDGAAEPLHLGPPRAALRAARGILADGPAYPATSGLDLLLLVEHKKIS